MTQRPTELSAREDEGPKPTSGLAIASLVCAILHVCGLGSLLAVIFGHRALGQTRRGERTGAGLAMAGLVLGYLGLVGTIVTFLFFRPQLP